MTNVGINIMDMNEAKSEVIKAGKELVELGLVARTWGNVSCRIDDKKFAITPSGIGYNRLVPENIVIVDMDTLEYEGAIPPSSEKGFHAAAYKIDSNVNFVIHTHQTYATCVSVAGFSNLSPTENEVELLGGEIGLSPHALSGTRKLTKNIAEELSKGRHAILMEKHGALLTGTNRQEAFKRASLLEGVCYRTMEDLPSFNDNPSVVSEKTEGEQIVFDGSPVDEVKEIIIRVYNQYPEFRNIMLLSSQAVMDSMKNVDLLPAIIDDFAQMIGGGMRVSSPENGANGLKGCNAVFVKGIGALCCAHNQSDCRAMLTLVEKNSLVYLNANRYGIFPQLSILNRNHLRKEYLNSYSKKI